MTKRRNNRKKSRFSILFPILTIIGIGIIAVLTSGYEKSWSHNWNGVSESIKDSVLVVRDIAYTGGTGPNGRSMEKYANKRLWIMDNATENELLNLTKYPNGTVKAICYEGLIRNSAFDKKTDLILESIKDKSNFIEEFFDTKKSFGLLIPKSTARVMLNYDIDLNDKLNRKIIVLELVY